VNWPVAKLIMEEGDPVRKNMSDLKKPLIGY